MDQRLQRRVQRYGWDKAAGIYERYWLQQLEPAQSRLLEMADLRMGERVLDVACGTGLVTFRAAAGVGANGEAIGTDISERMVELARRVAAQQRVRNVTFKRMGAEELSLSDESFDVALCALGLMYVPDPVQALKELHRTLKPGGRAVAAVWGERNRCGWAEIFPIVDSRVKSEVCPLFFLLGTRDVLQETFLAAGFTDVVFDRVATVLRYESPEEACGAAFAGGPVALAYSRFDERTRQEAHAEYLDSIEAYRKGGRFEVPGEFVIAGGHKA